jgi:hypothetical protein
MPRQSKPGPRLAVVAGTRTLNDVIIIVRKLKSYVVGAK